MVNNALLQLNDIPNFEELQASMIVPALHQLMDEAKQIIDKICHIAHTVSWENTIEPLVVILEKLERTWGVVSHLSAVKDTPEWRSAYNEMLPQVSDLYTSLFQNRTLLERYRQVYWLQKEGLSLERQRVLEQTLEDFKLAGAFLESEEKKELAQLTTELSMLESQFSQNVLDSTDAFGLFIDKKEPLKGIPQATLDLFRQAAQVEGQTDGYKIRLHYPYYYAVMRYAENRSLREQMHRAYATRASDLSDKPQWDNTPLIEAILVKRQRQAELLGYSDYVHLSLVKKMARESQEIEELMKQIIKQVKPLAEQEVSVLEDFARQNLGLEALQPWDIAFVSEKLREDQYAYSEEELMTYFEVSAVFKGLFDLVRKLYGVEFKYEKRPVWHPQVRYFRLLQEGKMIGGLYVDLYAREGKRSGAWMNEYCSRWQKEGKLQLPLVYLICNFTPPNQEGKSYLKHDDVVTLFHEMGHCLHSLLTEVDEPSIAGISGVEWDAVELPSQLMENFAWEWEVLQNISCYSEPQKSLPRSLFDQVSRARNFQIGLRTLRQIIFSLFDLRIHQAKASLWVSILTSVKEKLNLLPPASYDRMAHSFEHVFSGGYAAGYYSYIWAEVLSADAYAAFTEEDNPSATGERFRRELLSQGSSRPALDSFIAFRGRSYHIEPLLHQLGLLSHKELQ